MSNPAGTVMKGAGLYITTVCAMKAMSMVKKPRR